MPSQLAARALAFADGSGVPVPARRAATVILMRPAEAFEVFALRRVSTMEFAPSMYVFPGGSVDARDAQAQVGWAGPAPEWWASRLGLAEPDARAVVCAAIREVFEECGVLLAGVDESTVVGDVSGDEWEAARLALLAREVALADLLESRGLIVRSDLLVPWARWLTPDFEPRRFDTFFFLARMPMGQRTRDVGGEADHSLWAAPADLVTLPMLPPTVHTLRQLAALGTIDAALAASISHVLSTPLAPRVELDGEGVWLVVDPRSGI